MNTGGGLTGAREVSKAPIVLSARELTWLAYCAAGMADPEIAARMHISVHTARYHASNVIAKLGARNRPHAVFLALRRGALTDAVVGNAAGSSTNEPR